MLFDLQICYSLYAKILCQAVSLKASDQRTVEQLKDARDASDLASECRQQARAFRRHQIFLDLPFRNMRVHESRPDSYY